MATNYERAKELVGESQDHWLLAPFIEEDRVAAFEKARQAVALIEKDASADGSLSSEEGLVYVAALAFSNEDGYLPELVKDRLKPCVSGVYGIISEATLDDEGKDEWAMSLLGVVETTLGRYVDRFSHAEPEYTKAEHRISPTSYFNGLIALMNLRFVALRGVLVRKTLSWRLEKISSKLAALCLKEMVPLTRLPLIIRLLRKKK